MITLFNIALSLLILFIISIFLIEFCSLIYDSITMIIWPMGTALLSDIGIDIKVNKKLFTFLFFTLPMVLIFITGVFFIQFALCELDSYEQNPGKFLTFFIFYTIMYIGWNTIYDTAMAIMASNEREYEKSK